MDVPNKMFIDGQWTPSSDGQRIDIINPATEETVSSIPKATRQDVGRALYYWTLCIRRRRASGSGAGRG